MAECCADVIVAAHSPPLFTARGAAQPELSVLYQNLLVITQKQQSPLSVRRYNTRATDSPARDDGGGSGGARFALALKPRRPCLVNRTDSSKSLGNEADSSSSSSSDENEPTSPTRRKKKVVFADDRGLSLTHVRLMNEPSNQPPKLSLAVSPGGGVPSAQQVVAAAEPPQWTVRFSQPASSYLDFRKRLDVGNVSLENVIVKSPDRRLLGTVKVRNLSYDKDVFVRCTRDKWTTHQDTPCTYVQNNAMVSAVGYGGGGGGNAAPSLPAAPMQNVTAIYDTFSFGLPLPADATSVEFAVCYRCNEFECWDNNDGNNYCLSSNGQSAACGPSQQPLVSSSPSSSPSSPSSPSSSSSSSSSAQPATSSSVSAQAPVPAEFNHQHRQRHKHRPVHYFGAQSTSKHNSWRLSDTSSCYW